jgi:Mg2+/Co2+ transporter CorB
MNEFLVAVSVFFSLFLSGLLSASETAITAMSIAKIHKLKSNGNKRALIISRLREDKEKLISTILLANNGCNILSSTLATALLIDIFGNEGVIYATLIMTILIIVFAEIIPKTYALANPEKVALNFAKFLEITVKICHPVTKMISHTVEYIMKTLKIDNSAHLVSPTEEIKGTIDLHHSEGAVDQSDKYMLDGVFYLGETRVAEVMTHRKNMITLNLSQDVDAIIADLKKISHTRIPVWQDNPDNIVGILHTRDLLNNSLEAKEFTIDYLKSLLKEPMFIHENTPLDEQLTEFKNKKSRFAIVIDEYGGILGMITIYDILEEVVGRIQDERDPVRDELIVKEDYWITKGDFTIRDLNRKFNWHLPDNEASTIAGLLIHQAERIPEVGEQLNYFGFHFTILEKKLNQLTSIKISKNLDEEE